MKKSYETFRRNFENAKRIWNLEEDWITPVEYLPYIDALLGDIDLDPCSTEKANKDFIHAKNFYTKKEDGLNTEIAWTGKVYCFSSHLWTLLIQQEARLLAVESTWGCRSHESFYRLVSDA